MNKNEYTEIDLLESIKAIAVKYRKHQKKFFLILFSCVVLTIAFYFFFPKQYELTLVASSKNIKPQALEEMVRSVNAAAYDKDYVSVASVLKIQPDLAKSILTARLFPIRPEVLTPQQNGESYFELIVKVNSRDIRQDSLQKAFMRFFEENEIVAVRRKLSQRLNEKMAIKIEKEIEKLEQLRLDLFAGRNTDPKFIMMHPAAINQTIIDLNQRLNDIEYSLTLKDEFTLLQGFLPATKPSFPRLGITLAVGLAIGLIIALCAVALSND